LPLSIAAPGPPAGGEWDAFGDVIRDEAVFLGDRRRVDHALEAPFLVYATQNPIEQEGTPYPRPSATGSPRGTGRPRGG